MADTLHRSNCWRQERKNKKRKIKILNYKFNCYQNVILKVRINASFEEKSQKRVQEAWQICLWHKNQIKIKRFIYSIVRFPSLVRNLRFMFYFYFIRFWMNFKNTAIKTMRAIQKTNRNDSSFINCNQTHCLHSHGSIT